MLRILKIIVINIAVFLALLVFAEFSFRTLKSALRADNPLIVDDEYLGWSINEHLIPFDRRNRCGETVHLEPPHSKYVNYRSSSVESELMVLFIGDSFTHAHEVTHGAAYFNVFDDFNEDVNIAVSAVGGYGTAQQRILIDKVITDIDPDFIIWQLSSNDVANNVFALDNSSFYNNQRPRIYFDLNKKIFYLKNPGFWLFDVSKVFRWIFRRMLQIDRTYDLGLLNFLNSLIALEKDERRKAKRYGLEILKYLVNDAHELFGVPIFAFTTGSRFDKEYEELFRDSDVVYFSGFTNDSRFEDEKTNCEPLDGHWNKLGNAVAGQKLTELLLPYISRGNLSQ